MALTALQIKHAKEGMHADGSGLYLRVQASGAKSWIFRFQLNNKRREMGIGTLAAKPAPEARSEAAQLAAMIRNGIDPIEDRKAKAELVALESQKTVAAVTTFRQVATAYIDNHRASWKNAKHGQPAMGEHARTIRGPHHRRQTRWRDYDGRNSKHSPASVDHQD